MNGDKRTWEHTFAFIGAGNMASAFIFGLVDKGACNPGDIIIHRRDASKTAYIFQKVITSVKITSGHSRLLNSFFSP